MPIKESSVSEKCNGPWNNKCDSMSDDSQEKEIRKKSGIQFIKGILNVLLKLILLFSENLHIDYFIKLLEKITSNQWASYLFFQLAIQSLKNKINYFLFFYKKPLIKRAFSFRVCQIPFFSFSWDLRIASSSFSFAQIDEAVCLPLQQKFRFL